MSLAEHPVATQTPLPVFVSRARLIRRLARHQHRGCRGYGTQSAGTLTLVAWHADAARVEARLARRQVQPEQGVVVRSSLVRSVRGFTLVIS